MHFRALFNCILQPTGSSYVISGGSVELYAFSVFSHIFSISIKFGSLTTAVIMYNNNKQQSKIGGINSEWTIGSA